MKKLAIMLSLLIAVLLSACGDQENVTAECADFNVQTELFYLPDDLTFSTRIFYDDQFILSVDEGDTWSLCRYDYETQEITPIGYHSEKGRYISWIFPGEDNNFLLIESNDREEFYLDTVRESGEKVSEVKLNISDNAYLISACFSPPNRIIALATDNMGSKVLIFSTDGVLLKSLTSPIKDVFSLCMDANGIIYLTGHNGSNWCSIPINLEKLSFEKKVTSSVPTNCMFSGAVFGCDFCYYSDTTLYGYELAQAKELSLLNLNDYGIVGSGSGTQMFVSGDKAIVCLSLDEEGKFFVVRLSLSAEKADREKIILATYYADRELLLQVAAFNRSNNEYKIVVNDYSQYNTEERPNNGISILNTEIISGKYPDIIDFSHLRSLVDDYSRSGVLVDLYSCMEKDKSINRDDYIRSIMKQLEYNGSLFEAVPFFSIGTAATANQGKSDVSYLITQAEHGLRLFDLSDEREMMRVILSRTINYYIDEVEGKVIFNTESFSELMQLFALMNADKQNSEDKPLFYFAGISNFLEVQKYEALLGENVSFTGLPCPNGSGNSAGISQSLSIVSESPNIDGAWEFVKTFLSEDYQLSQASEGGWLYFPTNTNVLRIMIEDSMKKEYEIKDGVTVEKSKGGEMAEDLSVTYYAASPEQIDKIMKLIDSIDCIYSITDTELADIVFEAIQPFLNGDRSLESTIDVVRSKIEIYQNERIG